MTTALALADAVRTYGSLQALAGLSLDVQHGEIHAIIGLNGAGKTTVMKAVLGHTRLDAGEVRILGTSSPGPDQFACLGSVVDQPFGYPELTVRANIVHAARLHGVNRVAAGQAADEWIDRLALHRWAQRRTRGLSLGNRQRLGLACAAAHDPDLLILDEPTNALDPAGVLLLRDVLLEAAGRGAGVLVSSHHLDEVSRIADRITVIHAGRVVGALEPGQMQLEVAFFAMVRDWDERHPAEVEARA
jgi:ABC-2 type transport system ATP-binding protein